MKQNHMIPMRRQAAHAAVGASAQLAAWQLLDDAGYLAVSDDGEERTVTDQATTTRKFYRIEIANP